MKINVERDDNARASSKIHIRINETSASIKDEFNSRIEFRIKMKDLETIKLAIDVTIIIKIDRRRIK